MNVSIADGHARLIDFPYEPLMSAVYSGWREFLRAGEHYKDAWKLPRDPQIHEGPDIGYVLCALQGTPGAAENSRMEFFHYRPSLKDVLKERNIEFKNFHNWLTACDRLYDSCLAETVKIAAELSSGSAKNFAEMIAIGGAGLHTLSLFSYQDQVEAGGVIAQAHVDPCFLTLHLHETHLSLQLKHPEGGWNDYAHVPGKVLALPGKKAHSESDAQIRGVAHRVIALPAARPVRERRFAMSFFAHTGSRAVHAQAPELVAA